MAHPLCTKCGQEIAHDHLQFEGVLPVHKTCWGKPPPLPRYVSDVELPLPYMTREEFHTRVWMALLMVWLIAVILLP